MKVGIKKIHEDEWWVEVDFATIRLNYFQVHLLNIILKHVMHLGEEQHYELLHGFLTLLEKLNYLSDSDLQRLLREVRDQDLAWILQALQNEPLKQRMFKNMGPLLAKQLQQDLETMNPSAAEQVMEAIERVMRHAFALEVKGEIEFQTEVTEYI